MTYEKKFKWTLAGLILMIILNAVTLIMLWNNDPSKSDWGKSDVQNEKFEDRSSAQEYMKNRLGLTDAQADSLSELRRRHFREMRGMRQELETMRKNYFDSLMEGQVEQSVLDSMVSKMAQKSATIEKSMSNHMIEVNQHLNLQQRREFGQMMQDIFQHQKGRNDRSRKNDRPHRHGQN